jgi:hypothetical protein
MVHMDSSEGSNFVDQLRTSINETRKTMWKQLQPHELFNKINNYANVLILDGRTSEEYTRIHVDQSISFDWDEHLTEVFTVALQNRDSTRGLLECIFIIPQSSCSDAILDQIHHKVEECVASTNGNIVKPDENIPNTESKNSRSTSFYVRIYQMDEADSFFSRYQNCYFIKQGITYASSGSTIKSFVRYPNEILPNFLYLGDHSNGSNRHQLEALGITHLIDLTSQGLSRATANECGIQYLDINVTDDSCTRIEDHFQTTNAFIHQAYLVNKSDDSVASSSVVQYRKKFRNKIRS